MKKKGMMDEILDEIKKKIFAKPVEASGGPMERKEETSPVEPIAPPKGLANSIDGRNKALKDAAGYKKGGMVKKTEKALVHKGELVLTTKQVGKMKKAMKNGGCK